MAQIIVYRKEGRITAWEVKRLGLPDGTRRRYFMAGPRALTEIMRRWLADCRAIEAGMSSRP